MLMSFKANQLSNFPKKELRACEFVHDVLSCLSWDAILAQVLLEASARRKTFCGVAC